MLSGFPGSWLPMLICGIGLKVTEAEDLLASIIYKLLLNENENLKCGFWEICLEVWAYNS